MRTSDTICSNPSPSLALFCTFPYGLFLMIFNTRLLGEGLHPLVGRISPYLFTNIITAMIVEQVKNLRLWIFECRDPSAQAYRLGLAAAGVLGLAHVIANLLGGCNCICSQEALEKSPPNKQISVACLVFTWYFTLLEINFHLTTKTLNWVCFGFEKNRIILAVAMSMLVIGALGNNKSRASCGFTHHHFLSIGGILCFVHGLFCVAYYVTATAAE